MEMSTSKNQFKVSIETEKFLCNCLMDQNQSISERFRALFSLRNLRGSGPRNALIAATRDPSNLLAHEAAFALGQMQDAHAIPALEAVLNDFSLHPIVRHEAAEALGAIGLDSNIPLLRNSLVLDPAQEVRETCELALNRIEELRNSKKSIKKSSPFLSVDPAAAACCSSLDDLRDVLQNEDKNMYERYAALFALRNLGGHKAITAIIGSLSSKSALLKHEVAYVLGQLQDKASSEALSRILMDVNEHPMVRHEAAEALGSIAEGLVMGISKTELNLRRLLASAPNQQNQMKLLHYVATLREQLEDLSEEKTSEGLPRLSKALINEYSEKIEAIAAKLAVPVSDSKEIEEPRLAVFLVRESPSETMVETLPTSPGLRRRFQKPSSVEGKGHGSPDTDDAGPVKLDDAARSHIEKHRNLQEDLTNEMVGLARQLKESSQIMSQSLKNTEKILDSTEKAVEHSLANTGSANTRAVEIYSKTSKTTCFTWLLIFAMTCIFIMVVLLIRIT